MLAAGVEVLVHLINLLSVLLSCNGFAGIQKAVVSQMGSRPPKIDHDLFLFGASLALGSALELFIGLTTELVVAGFCVQSTFCHTSQSN